MSKELTPIELENNLGPDVNGVVQRVPWKAYDVDEVDVLLAEKDTEIRRLNRVLWLARANTARQKHDYFALYNNNSQYLRLNINGGYSPDEEGMVTMHTAVEWCMIWKKVATKCHAMAERYGEEK